MKEYNDYIELLNAKQKSERLNALKTLKQAIDSGKLSEINPSNDVNNHVHTTYSFSPYSPSRVVWEAYQAGLQTVGIMDHDSVAGCAEFLEATKIIGILGTIGVECRVNMSDTSLRGRRFNNPDEQDNVYMALHGIPHQNIDKVSDFFIPISNAREKRNRKMTDNINKIVSEYSIFIDYDKDVIPISKRKEGGSVTERHILFALSIKMIKQFSKGKKLVDFLSNELLLPLDKNIEMLLLDINNPYYEYDLLGVLKSHLVESFYIESNTQECPPVSKVLDLARQVGAISAYAYLGNVEESVTGDKKSQEFEDSYLDELFKLLKRLGFNAITYMPSRNTAIQLKRLRVLCNEYNFFQISGEDINSPRQSFVCEAQRAPEFSNLYDSTMALIGHEHVASSDIDMSMFSDKSIKKTPLLQERIALYKTFV